MPATSNVSLFRWELVDFAKKRADTRYSHLTSNQFTLSSRPSVQFELFAKYGDTMTWQDDLRVILKQLDDKPIEVSVRLWIEHTGGQKFGETFVEKYTFDKIGDFCGHKGLSNNEYKSFEKLYNNHDTFFLCCEMTDLNECITPIVKHEMTDLSGRVAPTIEHYQEFLQTLLASYERELHDAVVKVGDKEFKVMKAFLMCQSDVFERMFSSNFREGVTSEIEVKDVDEETMKHLIKWLYTSEIKEECSVEKLFAAADKYNIKLLNKMCTEKMLSTFDKKNVFDRLILSSMHSNAQLKETALNFISGLPATASIDFLASDEWVDFAIKNAAIAKDVGKLIREKMRK